MHAKSVLLLLFLLINTFLHLTELEEFNVDYWFHIKLVDSEMFSQNITYDKLLPLKFSPKLKHFSMLMETLINGCQFYPPLNSFLCVINSALLY